MSDFEGVSDIFNDENDNDLTPKSPEFYNVIHERPFGRGSIDVRMVKKHALWGDHLWNGGRWLANHLESHPELVEGKCVIELGAGAGLPSIIAANLGAALVTCTDYPDQELIDNLQHNFQVNCCSGTKVETIGYLWGDDISALERGVLNNNNNSNNNNNNKSHSYYDVLFLCDLLFNHSEHTKLIKSSLSLIGPSSTAFCVFTHYRPWLAHKDLDFLFRNEWMDAGWKWIKIAEERWELMFEADRGDAEMRRTVHAYQLIPLKD